MNNKEIASLIAEKLLDRKAKNITIIDIGEKSSFADFFINLTASSERQLSALSDYAEEIAIESGLEIKSSTGENSKGWILVDCGDIIINIFTEKMRDKYDLDRLWSDCDIKTIDWLWFVLRSEKWKTDIILKI